MIDVKTVGSDEIVAEMTIDASAETIFAALTDPKKLSAWWGDDQMYRADKWTVDLRVGGKWRAEGGRTGQPSGLLVEGEFLEIDPPKRLAYTWKPTWVEAPVTVVRYVLTPTANGTHLILTHTGFGGNEKALEAHQGWAQVLGWLKTYLQK